MCTNPASVMFEVNRSPTRPLKCWRRTNSRSVKPLSKRIVWKASGLIFDKVDISSDAESFNLTQRTCPGDKTIEPLASSIGFFSERVEPSNQLLTLATEGTSSLSKIMYCPKE